MKFQVFSDTHFESRPIKQMRPYADNLILAGDISSWSHHSLYEFLDYASDNWKFVFYVPGNHEFYCGGEAKSYQKIDQELRCEIGSRYSNVHYLNNDTIWLGVDGVSCQPSDGALCIIGSILWSSPTEVIEPIINDFRMIYSGENTISAAEMRTLNSAAIRYIKARISAAPTIVITHFPPIRGGTSPSRFMFSDENIKRYFSNTLDHIIYDNPQIEWWIFGHTHHAAAIEKGNCNLLTNAIGYSGEEITRARISLVDEIDPYSCVFSSKSF